MCAQMIPMIMGNPEARKGMSNVAKYLLIFGGLGVGILLFIFFIKKLNPFKIVGNLLKKAGEGVGGILKGLGGGLGAGLGGLFKGIGGLFGGISKTKVQVRPEDIYRDEYLRKYGMSEEDWEDMAHMSGDTRVTIAKLRRVKVATDEQLREREAIKRIERQRGERKSLKEFR